MIVTQTTPSWEKTVSKLIAIAWLDNEFYQHFANNAAKVLREAGVEIEEFADVTVNHNPTEVPGLWLAAENTYKLCLPPCPADLVDEKLFANQEKAPLCVLTTASCASICCC